jgi:S-disulfanyl-L-cysteine oxidoreductase SoxD
VTSQRAIGAALVMVACTVLHLAGAVRAFGASMGQDNAPRSVWQGVYTEAQAKRGMEAYQYSCATCHLPELDGDPGRDVPALRGDSFMESWNAHTMKDLFDLVSMSMPKDAPGTLRAQSYVDVLAYLLQVNEIPPGGAELTADSAALGRIRFDKAPPVGR